MPKRAPRPPITQARAYRLIVPVAFVAVALGTLLVLVLAAAVLFGILPYPGR